MAVLDKGAVEMEVEKRASSLDRAERAINDVLVREYGSMGHPEAGKQFAVSFPSDLLMDIVLKSRIAKSCEKAGLNVHEFKDDRDGPFVLLSY